jgi:hypothetical protein
MSALKSAPGYKKMIMANHPDAVEIAKAEMRESSYYSENGNTPLFVLSSIISSPRLFDVFWKDVGLQGLIQAGDTFVDKYTGLADNRQKTYAISLAQWIDISGRYDEVDKYEKLDISISKIQVWPFDPSTLSFEQMVLAIGVSYNEEELKEEPRLCGALRHLMREYRVEYYWEGREYG